MRIEGIPEGWELVRIGTPLIGEWVVCSDGRTLQWNHVTTNHGYAIVRKIEKLKQYRPFASAAEYFKNSLEGFAVDWKGNDLSPGFHAVVSANDSFIWVAVGTVIERFDWEQAFDRLEFRHRDSSTSPFGVEVQS